MVVPHWKKAVSDLLFEKVLGDKRSRTPHLGKRRNI